MKTFEQIIEACAKLARSGVKPYTDDGEDMGSTFVQVLEFNGEEEYGGHWFSGIPQLDSIVHIGEDVVGRVEEIHYVGADESGCGEILVYIVVDKEDRVKLD